MIVLCLMLVLFTFISEAQDLSLDDPPLRNRIMIETLDRGQVAVIGAAGAVFTPSQVAVRHLYTGTTAFANASFDGSFRVEVEGTPDAPYLVSVARSFPENERRTYKMLPGAGVVVQRPPDAQRNISFALGGELAFGASLWEADGQINQLDFAPGEWVSLLLDVRMSLPEANINLDYQMRGQLRLRRILDADGQQLSTAKDIQANWSSLLTPTGLPILGVSEADIILASANAENVQMDEENNTVSFRLSFDEIIPDDLAAGYYVPVFAGEAAIANSIFFDWYDNRILGTGGDSPTGSSETRLPLILRVGEVETPRLIWSVLDFIAAEDQDVAGLSNLVNHTPSTIIRQPGTYSLLPAILGLLPAGDEDTVPFVPLQSGRVSLAITRPDGTSEQLGDAIVVQPFVRDNQLRLGAFDLNMDYEFSDYGDYEIRLAGTVEDIYGNRYAGGGTYHLMIAEALRIHPAVLPGTTFTVGDLFNPLYETTPAMPPGAPRDIEFVVDHSKQEEPLQVCMDSGSVLPRLLLRCEFEWEQAGEYRIDYTVRYEDRAGRLWADSIRMAGVVVEAGAVASGQRGIADYDRQQQAWFDTSVYPADAPESSSIVHLPYFSGDVAYLPDAETAGLNPVLMGGDYQYINIVRPDGVSLRQFVRASDADFDARIHNEDLLNGQIGAGRAGNRPDDVLFIFGGTVSDATIAGYAAGAVVTNADSARVTPPFSQAVFSDQNKAIDLIFLPTDLRSGAIVLRDAAGGSEAVGMTGYLFPPLAGELTVQLSAQNQQPTILPTTRISPFGYYNGSVIEANRDGLWRIRAAATFNGPTSAGSLAGPISAQIPGAENNELFVFVALQDAPLLESNRDAISTVASGQAFLINLRVPQAWMDVRAYYVLRTASRILEQGELATFANQSNYQFNWPQIARLYPNLEATANEASDMDEITLSFAMIGTDEAGSQGFRVRTFTLRGNQLYSFNRREE